MNVVDKIAEVIDKIAEIIEGCRDEGYSDLHTAQAILDLKYPCKECGGNGEIQNRLAWDIPQSKETCPTCKGTGDGLPMLKIVDQDQMLPEIENNTGESAFDNGYYAGEKNQQTKMIKAGWFKGVRE